MHLVEHMLGLIALDRIMVFVQFSGDPDHPDIIQSGANSGEQLHSRCPCSVRTQIIGFPPKRVANATHVRQRT